MSIGNTVTILSMLTAMIVPSKAMAQSGSNRSFRLLWCGTSSTSRRLMTFTTGMLKAQGFPVEVSKKGDGYALIYEGVFDRVAIASGTYDYVIQQISSSTLINPKNVESARKHMQDFCRLVKQKKGIPVFFESFTKKEARGKQLQMRQLCLEEARKGGAKVAFCGTAFTAVLGEKGDEYLFARDGTHASTRGNYLMAACITAALTGKSPVGNLAVFSKKNKRLISEEDATYLQKKAWETTKKYSVKAGTKSQSASE